jgi:hypothetical protein
MYLYLFSPLNPQPFNYYLLPTRLIQRLKPTPIGHQPRFAFTSCLTGISFYALTISSYDRAIPTTQRVFLALLSPLSISPPSGLLVLKSLWILLEVLNGIEWHNAVATLNANEVAVSL